MITNEVNDYTSHQIITLKKVKKNKKNCIIKISEANRYK